MSKRFLYLSLLSLGIAGSATLAQAGPAVEWTLIENRSSKPWNLIVLTESGTISTGEEINGKSLKIFDAKGKCENPDGEGTYLSAKGSKAVIQPSGKCFFRVDPTKMDGEIDMNLRLEADPGGKSAPHCVLRLRTSSKQVLPATYESLDEKSKAAIQVDNAQLGTGDPAHPFIILAGE